MLPDVLPEPIEPLEPLELLPADEPLEPLVAPLPALLPSRSQAGEGGGEREGEGEGESAFHAGGSFRKPRLMQQTRRFRAPDFSGRAYAARARGVAVPHH